MVSLERPARRATCVIDQLENRTHFSFGDLDSSWGRSGVVKVTYGNDPALVDDFLVVNSRLDMQSDGKILIGNPLKGPDIYAPGYVISRRNSDGSIDKTFGKSGKLVFEYPSSDAIFFWFVGSDDTIDMSYTYSGLQDVSNPDTELRASKDGKNLTNLGETGEENTGFDPRAVHTHFTIPYTPTDAGAGHLPVGASSSAYLPDGTIIYARTSHTGKAVIGHLGVDGRPVNGTFVNSERYYSCGTPVQSKNLIVGNNGEVYLRAFSESQVTPYILKVSMPTPVLGSIQGFLFNDSNGNGRVDRGEDNPGPRTVFIDENGNGLLDSGERTSITVNGNYYFGGLSAGWHKIRRVLPKGYKVTNSLFTKGAIHVKLGKTTFAPGLGAMKV